MIQQFFNVAFEQRVRSSPIVRDCYMLSGEIDFNSELQPGDSFRVAFQKITRENGTVSYGDIQAAEFSNDGRRLEAFRFVLPDGKAITASGR